MEHTSNNNNKRHTPSKSDFAMETKKRPSPSKSPAIGAAGGGATSPSISSLSTQLAAVTNTPTPRAPPSVTPSSVSRFPPTANPRNTPSPAKPPFDNETTPEPAVGVPYTPRRLSFSNRLSLQMPSRGPLSPIIDPALGYSVARRPRLDFARSCTSLHHSTLAESSPDSSPLATSTGFPIPRGNTDHRALDSPFSHHSHYPGSSHASSLGSTSMLDYAPSGDDSSTDSDDDLDGDFDLMDTNSGSLGSAGHPSNATPMESAAAISLLNHQKARFGARLTSRRPSSSSRNRSMMTPSPIIQPTRTLMMGGNSGGYEYPMGRRGSLTLGPSALEYEIDRPEHGVVRRAVSRRGSLLPKTKNFQRIKAALIEESSPIDLEVKREAEITRQIREEDGPHNCKSPQQTQLEGRPSTMESELANIGEEEGTESGDSTSQSTRGVAISFSKQAERHASGGFWFGDQMEGINGSPPTFPGLRMGSDGDIIMNSDSCVNSPVSSIPPDMRRLKRRRTQDERFEPNVFKRRAVSPGLSNSPGHKMAQSPPTGKRLSFQGFSDTNDGIMKMTL